MLQFKLFAAEIPLIFRITVLLSALYVILQPGNDVWQTMTTTEQSSCPVSLRFRERDQPKAEAAVIPACRAREMQGPLYTSVSNRLTLGVAFSASRGALTSSGGWKFVMSWMLEYAGEC